MSLLALIFALLIEQVKPLSSRTFLNSWLRGYIDFFQRNLNGGEARHGQIAGLIAVLLPVLGAAIIFLNLEDKHPILAWAFCVLVLYLTMGFRQFSHYFTDINKALCKNDLGLARSLLSSWRGQSCDELSSEEVIRLTLEEALLASHQNVFAVIVWFVIFMLLGLGPSGAILYRLARFLNLHWSQTAGTELEMFGKFAARFYQLIEWLPVRLTAIVFAIAGNFEDAIYCWRTQSSNWPDHANGIVLASGAGALGVRLGMPVSQLEILVERPELGTGDIADIDFMQSAIGLVWRALVFWLIMLLLLSLASMASWVGA